MEARDGKDALQLAHSHAQDFNLLLTDVVMPGMSGQELADEIKRMHPKIRILFMSGYTSNAIVHRGVLDEGLSLLTKPFTRSGLVQKVHDMLKSSDAFRFAAPDCRLKISGRRRSSVVGEQERRRVGA